MCNIYGHVVAIKNEKSMEAEDLPGPGKNCFRAVPVRSDVHRSIEDSVYIA